MGPGEVYRLWKIRRTLRCLLGARGYNPEDVGVETLDELTEWTTDPEFDPTILVAKEDGDRIIVMFNTMPNDLGIKVIRDAIDVMNENVVTRAILVMRHGFTNHSSKYVKDLPCLDGGLRIEGFVESHLLFDHPRHFKVPPHRLLTPTEKTELQSRYRLKDDQMDQIQCTDAMAHYLGLVVGDVVEIRHPTPTAVMVEYRVCVDTE